MSSEHPDYCSVYDAVKRFKALGVNVGEKKVRKLCRGLKYTTGCGAQRIYLWINIEDAFRKSFKTTRQRLGADK